MKMSLSTFLKRMSQCAGAGLVLAAATTHGQTVTNTFTPISSFTPGDLVVIRTGDSTIADTPTFTGEAAVYLDEYTPAGTYVGTVNVALNGPQRLDTARRRGFRARRPAESVDQWPMDLLRRIQCRRTLRPARPPTPMHLLASWRVRSSTTAASLNTSTVVSSYGAGSANPYIRGATTIDGNEFWTFGKYPSSGATSNGGLAYVAGTGPSATTTTVEGFADWRNVVIANNQLYGGTGSSSVGNHGPYQISTGLPTTNLGNSLSNNTQLGSYPGGQSASALALLNLPADPNSQNGLNVLYTIGDQNTPGITKYYFNGSTWVNQTNIGLNSTNNIVNPTGLIAVQDPSNPNWVDITVSGTNGIYTYVDKSGYNGAIPSASGYASPAFTNIVANATFDQFRGVATVPTPEPSTFVLAGLGILGVLVARFRCKA